MAIVSVRPRFLGVLIVAVCPAACGISNPMCSLEIEPAVGVFVVDAATQASIADSAYGAVHDGAYVDSLRPSGVDTNGVPVSFRAADERPGVYTIDVLRPGYRPWSKAGVEVQRNVCHVQTVVLTASMDRL